MKANNSIDPQPSGISLKVLYFILECSGSQDGISPYTLKRTKTSSMIFMRTAMVTMLPGMVSLVAKRVVHRLGVHSTNS